MAATNARRCVSGLTTVTALVLILCAALARAGAGGDDPYPPFVADYDVRFNGLSMGTARISLRHSGADRYLFEQVAWSTGVAALFGSDKAVERSHLRFSENTIIPVEFKAQRKKGDDDDNAHLLFDQQALRVRNTGAGEHWDIEVPEGTLDKLLMQLALLIEIREGKTRFEYPVAIRGRVKHYRFEVVGEEPVDTAFGSFRTLKVARTDDDEDKSWIWIAPELDYFPVRFLKRKKSGVSTEMDLREMRFTATAPTAGGSIPSAD
jgi:hypothetical protein